jgi:hypothetical protein
MFQEAGQAGPNAGGIDHQVFTLPEIRQSFDLPV